MSASDTPDPAAPARPYQVLARKYRPATFADLIGQDAMVRTLRNAFDADRIAHAFVLTGVRGIGKTTTARIIAKGLNCIGPDGAGGPTIEPCGTCDPCIAIAEGRHVDVLEMDAASRTGVGDIREIIDSVNYRAASARYKVYIIDEVHMLSTSAFNALLKTLEEPPEHVKFLFATTEIRKVPVTVLSRCQRFDLRRIEPEVMIDHLNAIAKAEGATLDHDALALIVRAAEGSARDALSLLDQAIAHGQGAVTADMVRAMLGLADRGRVMDLFELVMRGDAAGALGELSAQYADGADPLAVLRDIAELTHWVSLMKIAPEAGDDPTVSPGERDRGRALAQDLPMPALTRMWQMALKALEEVASAPSPMMAAEMAVIRMTHVADMPTPGALMQKLAAMGPGPDPAPGGSGSSGGGGTSTGSASSNNTVGQARSGSAGGGLQAGTGGGLQGGTTARGLSVVSGGSASAGREALRHADEPAPETAQGLQPDAGSDALHRFVSFDEVVALIRARRDVRLLIEVETHLRLARYSPGRIEFQPTAEAPKDLAARLARQLQAWTGARWGVSVVSDGGGPTLAETRAAHRSDLVGQALGHPMVQAVIAAFPGLSDDDIRVNDPVPAEPEPGEAAPPPDDDWDPLDAFD